MARLKKHIGTNLDKLTRAFPYQREAIDAVENLPYSAIFFEQGLGKTKIAIDLTLDWLRSDSVDTVIIVTKKGLIRNWLQEFEIHSHLRPRVISSNRAANHSVLFSLCRVFVANFEAIALEEKKLLAMSKHRSIAIILDESQKIKNPNSKLTEAFLRISSCFIKRVIMTGTPMANRPFDIWSQVCFLDGGASLGSSFEKFKLSLDLPDNKNKGSFIRELKKVYPSIAEFAVRETKESSGLELPGKVYEIVYAEWEPEQLEIYTKIKDDLRVEILKDGKIEVDHSEALLKRLLRLLQVASNPSVIDEAYDKIPGKTNKAETLVEEITASGEKLIIWTSFVLNCRYLYKHFSSYGTVQINGKMTMEDRDKSVQRFKTDDSVKVLIATPASAKEGLTLTAANHVIFYDRSFSLDDYSQAQDRIHRISQTKTCYVTNIVMPDSIDQWVDALISLKSAAVSVGMGDGGDVTLDSLLDYDMSEILNIVLGEN